MQSKTFNKNIKMETFMKKELRKYYEGTFYRSFEWKLNSAVGKKMATQDFHRDRRERNKSMITLLEKVTIPSKSVGRRELEDFESFFFCELASFWCLWMPLNYYMNGKRCETETLGFVADFAWKTYLWSVKRWQSEQESLWRLKVEMKFEQHIWFHRGFQNENP